MPSHCLLWTLPVANIWQSWYSQVTLQQHWESLTFSSMHSRDRRKTWPKKLAMGVPHKTFKLGLISIKPPISLGCLSKAYLSLNSWNQGSWLKVARTGLPPEKPDSENPSPNPNLGRSTLPPPRKKTLESRFQTLVNCGKGGFDLNQLRSHLGWELTNSPAV